MKLIISKILSPHSFYSPYISFKILSVFFSQQIEKVLKHFIIQGGQKSKRNKREKTIQINILSNYTQLQANSSTGGTTSDS